MTENDATVSAAPPKKFKLTLKLNSSSSSSSSTPLEGSTSAATTPVSSQVNSSTTASPIKTCVPVSTAGPETESSTSAPFVNILPVPPSSFSDLPTGLGNLKGRGRPKKANESVKSAADEFSVTSNGPAASFTNPNPNTNLNPKSSSVATETSTTTTEKSEYSADLKSFVISMKTFQSRKWSLKRPLRLETKNLANFELKLPAGLWTTETFELASSHLSVNSTANTNPTTGPSVDYLAIFEATCKCGKVFNDRSKYRKHSKIHDKPVALVEEPVSSVKIVDNEDSVKRNNLTLTPTISLKLKLNTNTSSNNINTNANTNQVQNQ